MTRLRQRVRLVGIYLPIFVGFAVFVVTALWYPRLADPIAIHWDPLDPDGLTSRSAFLIIAPALVILSSIPTAVITLVGKTWSLAHRVLASLSAGIAVLLGGVMVAVARSSRDLAGGAVAPSPSLLIPALLGVAVWVGAFVALPAAATGAASPARAAVGLEGAPEWSATVFPEGRIALVLGVSMVPLVIISAWAASTDPTSGVVLGLILAASVLILVGALVFRIRITPAGFFARSILGWPRICVPVETIESVEIKWIDPLGDFGGWGIRYAGKKRLGLVFREGDGLMITQRSGRIVGVTLDDAERAGAALLAAVEKQQAAE